MKLTLIALLMTILVISGCGEIKEPIASDIEDLLDKPEKVTQGLDAVAPAEQSTTAAPSATATRDSGLDRIPEPSVEDVVGSRRVAPSWPEGKRAERRSEVTSEETFDVIKNNAATMRNLEVNYFSQTQ